MILSVLGTGVISSKIIWIHIWRVPSEIPTPKMRSIGVLIYSYKNIVCKVECAYCVISKVD